MTNLALHAGKVLAHLKQKRKDKGFQIVNTLWEALKKVAEQAAEKNLNQWNEWKTWKFDESPSLQKLLDRDFTNTKKPLVLPNEGYYKWVTFAIQLENALMTKVDFQTLVWGEQQGKQKKYSPQAD